MARRSGRLKDNLNTMSGNLLLTTDVKTEQDWLRPTSPSLPYMLCRAHRDSSLWAVCS